MFEWYSSNPINSIFTHITVLGDTITVYAKTTMIKMKKSEPGVRMGARELSFLKRPLKCSVNGVPTTFTYRNLLENSAEHNKRNLHKPDEKRATHIHYSKLNGESITPDEFQCFIQCIADHQSDPAARKTLQQEQQRGFNYFADWLYSWTEWVDATFFNLHDLFILPTDVKPLLQSYERFWQNSISQPQMQVLFNEADAQNKALESAIKDYDDAASNLEECDESLSQIQQAIIEHNSLFQEIDKIKQMLGKIQAQLTLQQSNEIPNAKINEIRSQLTETEAQLRSIKSTAEKQFNESKNSYNSHGICFWRDPKIIPTVQPVCPLIAPMLYLR